MLFRSVSGNMLEIPKTGTANLKTYVWEQGTLRPITEPECFYDINIFSENNILINSGFESSLPSESANEFTLGWREKL